jgi:hypothetical protein
MLHCGACNSETLRRDTALVGFLPCQGVGFGGGGVPERRVIAMVVERGGVGGGAQQ